MVVVGIPGLGFLDFPVFWMQEILNFEIQNSHSLTINYNDP